MTNSPNGFAFRKHGDNVLVFHHGRLATTLRDDDAVRFLADVGAGDDQEVMSQVVGRANRGASRVSNIHPRNQFR